MPTIIHKLRNLLDADKDNTIEIVDTGPFPGDGEDPADYRTIPPSGGRQRLLSMLHSKDGNGNPVFVGLTDLSMVFDQSAGAHIAGLPPLPQTQVAPVASTAPEEEVVTKPAKRNKE